MRNLKKYLAVLLTVAMLITSMAPVFADTAATLSADAQSCKDLGMLVGDSDAGVTAAYVGTTPTRAQAAVMFLRLKGLEAEAKAFKGTNNFSDVSASNWFAPYAAYLKANPALGFEGVGDNKFDPEAKITAQQYYKVVLTALGYKQGADFEWSGVSSFAADKGLSKVASASNFTVADLATATVEGLKAKAKDSTDTLAQKLIAVGAISVEKAVYAGVYTKATPAPSAKGFELTNKSKTLTVTLTYEPADASKVVFTTTRDAGIAVDAKFTPDAKDKKVFTYTSSINLVAGEYKVAVKDDTTDLGSKTVTIKDEKIAGIEVTSKQIIRYSDTEGYAYYKVTNQYGEDVTALPIASNITWTSSLTNGLDTVDKGSIKFSYNKGDTGYLSKLRDFTTTPIVLSAYDKDSGVVVTKQLNVSVAVGDIQGIKLNKIYNKDNKTEIYRNNTTDEFYIDYTITDSNGDAITSYDILYNAMTVYPDANAGNPNIAAVKIKQDPADTKKALFQVVLKANPTMANPYDGVGTQPINFVATGTGKSGTINIEVKDSTTQLETFTIQRPTVDVTEGSGYIEIPYIAVDKNGNTLTNASDIKGYITFSDESKVRQVVTPDGKYKLFYDFTGKAVDQVESFTVTVARTFKYSTINVTIKAVSLPKTLSSIPYAQYMAPTAYDNKIASDFKVLDKYGATVDLRHYYTPVEVDTDFSASAQQYDYFIVAEKLTNPESFKIEGIPFGSELYSGGDSQYYSKMTITAQAYPGTSSDIKFYLLKKAKTTNFIMTGQTLDATGKIVDNGVLPRTATGNVKPINDAKVYLAAKGADGKNLFKVVDSKVMTLYNVKPKDITGYTLEAISTPLYSFDKFGAQPSELNNVAITDGFGNNYTISQVKSNINGGTWKESQQIKARGLLAGGTKVLLPAPFAPSSFSLRQSTAQVGIVKFDVSDTTRFGTVDDFVYAKNLPNDETSAETTVYAMIRGYDNQIYTPSTTVKASTVAPTAQSAEVVMLGSYREKVGTGALNYYEYQLTESPIRKKADNYYEISVANFNKFFLNLVKDANGEYTQQDSALNNNNPAGTRFFSAQKSHLEGASALRFRFKDQYGKNDVFDAWHSPSAMYLVSDAGGKYRLKVANGVNQPTIEKTSNAVKVEADDELVITATRDGKSITVTIRVTP